MGSVNQAQGRRGELLLAETNIGFFNAINWQRIWPERDRWSFAQADNMAAYHRENGLPMTAQHFVFEQELLDATPAWVLEIDDPDELRALLVERAEVIFERYPDLDRINVLNEPLPTLVRGKRHRGYAAPFLALGKASKRGCLCALDDV